MERYDNFSVLPQGSVGGLTAPSTEGFERSGRQLQAFSQQVERAGQQMTEIALKEQEKVNTLRVLQAENEAREEALRLAADKQEGYAHIQGYDAAHRASGKSLGQEYGERYRKRLDEIMGGLSNDAQRQAFAESGMRLLGQFEGKVAEHEFREYRNWSLSVVKGSAELAGQEIALNYADPDILTDRLGKLDIAVAEQGRLQGFSASETEANQRTARSTALAMAMAAAIDAGDPTTAQHLFDAHKDKLLAPDRARIETPLRRETEGRLALDITDAVFGEIPGTGAAPPSVERVFNSLVTQESSGRRGVAGPLTQYGRAHGLAQVLDSTGQGVARKLGIAWRPDLMRGTSEEAGAYQLKIGRAYFEEGLTKHNGDFRLALMYYHGGPDQRKWGLKTRAYAAEVLQRAGAPAAAAQGDQPVTVAATLGDAIREGRNRLLDIRPDAPLSLIKGVEDEITRRWQIGEKDQADADEQALGSAFTALMQNGGNVNALPGEVKRAIRPDQWDSVLAFGRSVRGDKQERDPDRDDRLYNFALTNPETLRDGSDAAFLRNYQGHPRFAEIAKYRAQLRGLAADPKKDAAGKIDYPAINRVVDNRLGSIDIDVKNYANGARVGAIRRHVNSVVASEQRRLGRQLTDAEIETTIDRQFAMTTGWRDWTGRPDGRKPSLSLTAGEIDPKTRKEIEGALKRAGQATNEQNILTMYFAWKAGGGGR